MEETAATTSTIAQNVANVQTNAKDIDRMADEGTQLANEVSKRATELASTTELASRKTMEISEVIGLDDRGNIILNPLFKFHEDTKKSTIDRVVGSLQRTSNKMVKTDKLELAGIHITI